MKPGPKPKLKKGERIVARSVSLTPEDWRWCITEASKNGGSVSAVIRKAVKLLKEIEV